MYIESEDFRNLWCLAHQWAGHDPDKTDVNKLPSQVELNLKRLASAVLRRALKARTVKLAIFVDHSLLDLLFNYKHIFKLLKCRSGKTFDKSYLESIFVRRHHFLQWCEKEKYPNSDFWILTQVTESHIVSNRPKSESEDKAICRAIAKVYWDIDQEIHPTHMVRSKAIRIYGNGNLYKDEKTIKSWIADLDPLQKTRKTGRPEDKVYKVDLETGGLIT